MFTVPPRLFASVVVVSLLGLGCSRTPEPEFSSVTIEDGELPELHQKQIEAGLRQMFGTPLRPKLAMTVDFSGTEFSDEAEEDSEAEDEEEAGDPTEAEDSVDQAEAPTITLVDVDRLRHGSSVYQKRCSGCHGETGDGNGPAAEYLVPKPRDYRKGVFKFTSTPYGLRPARQDLERVIRRGAKGTSMPAFRWLAEEDLDAVVDYVIYLSLRGTVAGGLAYIAEDYEEDELLFPEDFEETMADEIESWESAEDEVVLAVSAQPKYTEETVKLGRTAFIKSSCYSCHGTDAKGQVEWLNPEFLQAQKALPADQQIQINYDAWGHPAPAANITARLLHGGRRPIDIYRRIYTGINGTPMPQFGQIFEENPDTIWHLVHYVIHIVEGGDPAVGISVEDVMSEEPAAEDAAFVEPDSDSSSS